MEYRYKQLEAELSGLSKLLVDLGSRLSDAGREVTASAVLPSDKLVEQIAASRASFESARAKVHGHAAAMLVSPLPKQDELTSIAAMSSLLKGAAVAEENKYSTEGERDRALKALARALTLAHREVADFKPLQECHAKLTDLRKAILNVTWPHRHPESEALAESRHPANALLHFVENLDTIEDEQWIALEATISGAYGKPLFVAATRGKLEIRGDKAESKAEPKSETKVEVKPTPKPVAAEKPVEKPVVVEEKVLEKPAVTPVAVAPVPVVPAAQPAPAPVTKKIVVPAPPAVAPAPVVVAEKKEVAPEKAPEKPAVVPQPVVMAPPAAAPVGVTPVVAATHLPEAAPRVTIPEKKEPADKPQPVLSPSLAPVPAVSVPPMAHAPAAIVSAPAPRAAAPVTVTAASAEAPPAPARATPPAPVAATPAPTPAAPPIPAAPPVSAAPSNATLNSLSALATATEPPAEKKTVEAAEHQRRDARLAAPTPQPVLKGESSATNGAAAEEDQKTADGEAQRPQRWGFWRGNR